MTFLKGRLHRGIFRRIRWRARRLHGLPRLLGRTIPRCHPKGFLRPRRSAGDNQCGTKGCRRHGGCNPYGDRPWGSWVIRPSAGYCSGDTNDSRTESGAPSAGRGGSSGGGPEDGVAAAAAMDRTMVAAAVKRRTGLGIERILETTTELGMEAVRVCPLLLYWA